MYDPGVFEDRVDPEEPRKNDWRSQYSRDKARIIHGAGLRRLQGKTQVMGAGEGDFHRTRLTHSMEVAQIGLGLFEGLTKRKDIEIPEKLVPFTTHDRSVITAACYAHDLGHPPFGHGGERALHERMKYHGGFEGNAQTIRLLVKLEKYYENRGINPTRRVLLSVLKYPVDFDAYPEEFQTKEKPPKCYYHSESEIIKWALEPFPVPDRIEFQKLQEVDGKFKPKHMTFDASIMECADDIAYCTHDLEDIVARRLVGQKLLMEKVETIDLNGSTLKIDDFTNLFKDSHERKRFIGKLVNLLMTNTKIVCLDSFEHPLLKYRLSINDDLKSVTDFLRTDLTYGMVISKPEVQMLERKGQRIISALYDEYISDPSQLIPKWEKMDSNDPVARRVSDYIAGMTDSYATKIYHRLFTPGIGSSRDEL
jgi:dGTPase